ncbi:hypothetical protein [Cryptosporangium minutisporangium]|uniref:Peptidase C39-like domain-containing protein n=1 Tax=Cryptosporangium minutisporangium TaxID=113569 RepID=A0ABP6STK9_9ACTN
MDAWFDPLRVGPVTYAGRPFAQTDGTTCGTTAILLARVLADPEYARELTSGGGPEAFGQRLVTEQLRVRHRTNTVWPRALGTTPWGVRRGLAEETGDRYVVRWTIRTGRRARARTVDRVLAAVDAGRPVPLLVGNLYPAHYLLVVAHRDDRVLIYNPAGGRVAGLRVDELRGGRLAGVTAFRCLFAVLLPAG